MWVTAAVGAAAGAGLPVLAVTATGAYLVVTLAFPQVVRRLWRNGAGMSLRVSYPDGRGILRQVLEAVTDLGFTVDQLATKRSGPTARAPGRPATRARSRSRCGSAARARSVTWRPSCPRCPG
ncbi:MAG: hypothetical protein ACYCVZ_07620 [Streptosporangiaceae bacterium]